MQRLLLEKEDAADLEAVRHLRQLLSHTVSLVSKDEALREKITLCFSEAATNIVQHGEPQAQSIVLRFCCDENTLWIDILDNGGVWRPDDIPSEGQALKADLAAGGRGVHLLRSQTDELLYHPGDAEHYNVLRLCWRKATLHKKPTILIVEDDASLRRLYSAYLQSDFHVVCAADGQNALSVIQRESVDVVLSDIRMPRMSGLNLREALNQCRETSLIPFVFLSAADDDFTQTQATQLGIDDYLLKPIDKDKLLITLSRVLKRSKQIVHHLSDRIDQRISATLAPSLPKQSHGWRLAVASRNTGVGGGDLLLHQHCADHLSLALVDIMGHDDTAKFFAHAYGGYLRGIMRAGYSSRGDLAPEQLLEELSQGAFEDELLSQITLTSLAGRLQKEGCLALASAGHPAPLLITANGVEPLETEGMLPGLIEHTRYRPCIHQMKPGQRIALYTDGLFESAHDEPSRQALQSAICRALVQSIDSNIQEALEQTMQVFDETTAQAPSDDALLLLIEYTR